MRSSITKAMKADALALYRATYGTKGANNAALWAALSVMLNAVKRHEQCEAAVRLINLCLEGKSEFARSLWATKKVAAKKAIAKKAIVAKQGKTLIKNLRTIAVEMRDVAFTAVGLVEETSVAKKEAFKARRAKKALFKGADVIRFVGDGAKTLIEKAKAFSKAAADAVDAAWSKLCNGAMSIVSSFQYVVHQIKKWGCGCDYSDEQFAARCDRKYIARAYRCADIASLYI